MWQLTNPTIQTITVNREDSGQGKVNVSQLFDDSLRLINSIESVNWADKAIQFEICHCGIVGCQPGGWVSIRRVGDRAVIMPAFQAIAETHKSLCNEYLPPAYLLEKGALWINRQDYINTLCQLAPFPNFEVLSPLLEWEAAKLIQLETPHQILGILSEAPVLLADIIIASSEGSFLEQVPKFIEHLNKLMASDRPVTLRQTTTQDTAISFYIDVAGCPEWHALSYNRQQYSLCLSSGYLID